MPQDEDRVFDVSKPHKTSPSASSRPIIVGHHPIMNDPMVTDGRPDEPEHSEESAKPTHVQVSFDQSEPSNTPLDHHMLEHKPSEVSADNSKGSFFLPPEAADEPKAPNAPAQAAQAAEAVYPEHKAAHSPASTEPATVPDGSSVTPGIQPELSSLSDLPLPTRHGSRPARGGSKKLLRIAIILMVLLGIYAVLDAKTSISLPFYVFRKTTPASQTQTSSSAPVATTQSSSTPAGVVPTGFTAYSLAAASASFDYPTTWGTPAVTTDPGFGQRGGSSKSDGNYAYLVNFANNKDVQLAFTSSKFLPTARTTLYYDFLQWCVGTNDGKFYKTQMHFATNGDVDTPTTTTCDQGPLTDATKLDGSTIAQLNTKAADGTSLGDLYTKNLTDTSLPVVRVKDAVMSNGNYIKTLLGSVKIAASPSSVNP